MRSNELLICFAAREIVLWPSAMMLVAWIVLLCFCFITIFYLGVFVCLCKHVMVLTMEKQYAYVWQFLLLFRMKFDIKFHKNAFYSAILNDFYTSFHTKLCIKIIHQMVWVQFHEISYDVVMANLIWMLHLVRCFYTLCYYRRCRQSISFQYSRLLV